MKKLVFVLMGLVCSLVIVSHPTCGQNGFDEAVEIAEELEDSAKVDTAIDDELESERQLKKLLNFVTPLMAILRRNRGSRNESLPPAAAARKNIKRKYFDPYYDDYNLDRNGYDHFDRNGYGGGGGGYCCQQKDDLLPLLALLGLAGLLLYLIVIASTTTTAAGRRKKRSSDDNSENEDNWIINDENIGKVICYSFCRMKALMVKSHLLCYPTKI